MCNQLNRHIEASLKFSHNIPFEDKRSQFCLNCHKSVDVWRYENNLLGTKAGVQINHSKQVIGI